MGLQAAVMEPSHPSQRRDLIATVG